MQQDPCDDEDEEQEDEDSDDDQEDNSETDTDYEIDLADVGPQEKLHGTVTKTKADSGYGFIRCVGIDEDIFVHCTSVLNQPANGQFLKVNDKVEFNLATRNNRWQAKNVRVVNDDDWIETIITNKQCLSQQEKYSSLTPA